VTRSRLFSALLLASSVLLSSCAKTDGSRETAAPLRTTAAVLATARDGSQCQAGIYSHDAPPAGESHVGMVWIPGGEFSMGSNNAKFADARPFHRVRISGFWLARTPVTNDQFAAFVRATHYTTVAERKPSQQDFPDAAPKDLVPGSLVFTPPSHPVVTDDVRKWWRFQPGANWRHPEGPGSSIAGKEDHPVVQIAFEDAQAYAKWAGMRLPTEAEYEYAERGGLDCRRFAWGSVFAPRGMQMTNWYQGHFPNKSIAPNNDPTTTSVYRFPQNGYGLYDMAGNVWEWNVDYYRADYYAQLAKSDGVTVDPAGPPVSYDPKEPGVVKRSARGGSFLCTDQLSFCSRNEVGERSAVEPSSSANHMGFRVALSAK